MTKQQLLESLRLHQVVILRGTPGSGKSTLVDAIKERFRVAHCSADHHRMKDGRYVFNPAENDNVHGGCMRDFVEAVQGLGDFEVVIVDNTNCAVTEMAPYVAVAKAYGWKPVVVTVAADPEVAAARNVHGVPKDKVLAMHDRLVAANRHIPGHWTHLIIDNDKESEAA